MEAIGLLSGYLSPSQFIAKLVVDSVLRIIEYRKEGATARQQHELELNGLKARSTLSAVTLTAGIFTSAFQLLDSSASRSYEHTESVQRYALQLESNSTFREKMELDERRCEREHEFRLQEIEEIDKRHKRECALQKAVAKSILGKYKATVSLVQFITCYVFIGLCLSWRYADKVAQTCMLVLTVLSLVGTSMLISTSTKSIISTVKNTDMTKDLGRLQ